MQTEAKKESNKKKMKVVIYGVGQLMCCQNKISLVLGQTIFTT